MFKDIRLHGFANDRIEFYAIAAGADAYRRYFFSADPNGNSRFFIPGNEFAITPEGVQYSGNGGAFCEYMFGVDQPVADLAKTEVRNRLVLYGTRYGQRAGRLSFGGPSEGSQSFERIFFNGNAICNYFFALSGAAVAGSFREQQERIVRLLGKALKRSAAVGIEDDNAIISQILDPLDDPTAHILLFKLIHVKHRMYRDAFRSLYYRDKSIDDAAFSGLLQLGRECGIDRYQQERIRIDVMYKHRDNRRIVDEYRNMLIACHRKGEIDRLDNARLTRLRTLSVRNKIPGALFYTLDELLKNDKKLVGYEESGYISETRQILEGIFLTERQIESRIDTEDMLRLLRAKKMAVEQRDRGFEEMLLEASRSCDEKIRDGADMSILEGYSYIITYFDRYDATSAAVNHLAFMENIRITEEVIRSILGHKSAFDLLDPDLFHELFLAGILENKYLGNYGRKKITHLARGLKLIRENRLTIAGLLDQLQRIDAEERLYRRLLQQIKERMRTFYSNYTTVEEQEALKRELKGELRPEELILAEIPAAIFQEAIYTIQKEAFYIQHLLPQIAASGDHRLREDFLANSGLDRFYIEELEREFAQPAQEGEEPQLP